MSKFKSLGMKVQELCQVYEIRHADEQQDDDDDEPEIINTQRHPTRSLTYHMLFTLAVRIINIEKKMHYSLNKLYQYF